MQITNVLLPLPRFGNLPRFLHRYEHRPPPLTVLLPPPSDTVLISFRIRKSVILMTWAELFFYTTIAGSNNIYICIYRVGEMACCTSNTNLNCRFSQKFGEINFFAQFIPSSSHMTLCRRIVKKYWLIGKSNC